MFNNSPNPNQLVSGYSPKNSPKYGIHQTFSTDDSERTGTNGYRFKMPEVWTSARSGRKLITVRKIEWIPKREYLKFKIFIKKDSDQSITSFIYISIVPEKTPLNDALDDILKNFMAWATSTNQKIILSTEFFDSTLTFGVIPSEGNEKYSIKVVDLNEINPNSTKPSESFNRFLNQPLTFFHDFSESIIYNSVWDRNSTLHFHASFVPFDSYQYLGSMWDIWYNPITYQDPNSSPLFNIWTTTDLKKPLPILHETFIFRFTFIIDDQKYIS